MMRGLVVFRSVREALNAGYQIYGKTESGYLARTRTPSGWAMAIVDLGKDNALER
jgi:hypothetical protein